VVRDRVSDAALPGLVKSSVSSIPPSSSWRVNKQTDVPATITSPRGRRQSGSRSGSPILSAGQSRDDEGIEVGTKIVSDVWYGEYLDATLIDGPHWRRGLDLWNAARSSDLIVTQLAPPIFPLVIAEAIARRRRLVFTQLQRQRPPGWLRRLLLHGLLSALQPMFRRTVAGAQVLSSWEREVCAEVFGIPLERIRFIPQPFEAARPWTRGA
jgi:hypothetical protein